MRSAPPTQDPLTADLVRRQRANGQDWQTSAVTEAIRPARAADVYAITAMASERRNQYGRYQPIFWRPAANAEEVHRPHLAQLVADQNVITLVR